MERIPLRDGVAPRQQLDEQRAATGKRWGYLPHQGTREQERRRRRLKLAAALKLAAVMAGAPST